MSEFKLKRRLPPNTERQRVCDELMEYAETYVERDEFRTIIRLYAKKHNFQLTNDK